MTPLSIVVWFNRAYKAIGLNGCSSHSGRRTFITGRRGWCIGQGAPCGMFSCLLATDRSRRPRGYIDGDSDSQRRLVALI